MKTPVYRNGMKLLPLVAASLLASRLTDFVRAEDYRVVHTSDGFTSLDYAVINNSGEVVFTATKVIDGKSVHGVYKSAGGGGFQTIIEGEVGLLVNVNGQTFEGSKFRADRPVAINSAGVVAVAGLMQRGSLFDGAVYVGSGPITPTTWLDNPDSFPLRGPADSWDLSLNDNNTVASGRTVYMPPRDPLDVFQICDCPGQGLNNRNERLVGVLDTANNFAIYLVRFDFVARSPSPGSIRGLAPVRTNLVLTIAAGTGFFGAQVNSRGTVVYQAAFANGVSGIYRSSGAPVIETGPAGTTEYNPITLFSLNENDEVAFLTRSRTWNSKRGFFRGPHPLFFNQRADHSRQL